MTQPFSGTSDHGSRLDVSDEYSMGNQERWRGAMMIRSELVRGWVYDTLARLAGSGPRYKMRFDP
ncbi:MAG TPA: hypothetical protein VFV34_02985, partial [Blastocatellia bacterium]|nr:hypothetical protein [Blastocatellia bacterium]